VGANSSTRPYLKKSLHKTRAGGVAQGEGPKFKLQYHKKKKRKKEKRADASGKGQCTVLFHLG
jgi:hypothetical protein